MPIVKKDRKISVDVELEEVHSILLMNNDKTTFEAVIDLLMNVFSHSEEDARQAAGFIHTLGQKAVFKGSKAECGKKVLVAKAFCMEKDLTIKPCQHYMLLNFHVVSNGK